MLLGVASYLGYIVVHRAPKNACLLLWAPTLNDVMSQSEVTTIIFHFKSISLIIVVYLSWAKVAFVYKCYQAIAQIFDLKKP